MPIDKDGDAQVKCDVCGREFSKRGLATHLRTAHQPTEPVEPADSPLLVTSYPGSPPAETPSSPPPTDPTAEIQCIYCGVRFESQFLDRHQAAMHKGLPLQNDAALPVGSEKLAPGSPVRTSDMSTAKVRWTQRWIELGWECENHDHHDPARSGWRKQSEDGTPPTCDICRQPMRKMFQMQEYDAPDNSPSTATFQGVTYLVRPGMTNLLPDVIISILRAANEARKAAHLRQQDSDPVIGTRLASVGFLPPLDADDDNAGAPAAQEAAPAAPSAAPVG